MKKFISLVLMACLLLSLTACGNSDTNSMEVVGEVFEEENVSSESTVSVDNENLNQSNLTNHTHNFYGATCTKPAQCDCGVKNGSALGHNYSGKTCTRCGDANPNYVEKTQTDHTHFYSSSVTKEATCGAEGVKTFECSCGDTYTESISKKTYHDWEYATCSSPKKCKVCGKTEGTKKEHDYNTYGDYKCNMCGEVDPKVQETLSKCSLKLPDFPALIKYYDYSDKIKSEVSVTAITYNFEYYGDGKVILTAKFSGTKTYDANGAGQSAACNIGWKLYDSSGNVFTTGMFDSPSVAMGESFANKEEDLIYNFQATDPGEFRLEILNVNH